MNSQGFKDASGANVYQACEGDFRKGVSFNYARLRESVHHSVAQDDDGRLSITINKDAPDIDEVFLSQGVSIPPDEILNFVNKTNLRIPMKLREDFGESAKLPSSELLKALHYYTSHRVAESPNRTMLERGFDETALLALGMVVEQWVDDMVDQSIAQYFAEDAGEDGSGSEEDEEVVVPELDPLSVLDSDLSDDNE